jgi:hypothetical protein
MCALWAQKKMLHLLHPHKIVVVAPWLMATGVIFSLSLISKDCNAKISLSD